MQLALAKDGLIQEIERLSSALTAEFKIVQENDVFIKSFFSDLVANGVCPGSKGNNTLLRLNIGGHSVDIKLSALTAAQWNCFSCILAPHWHPYLLKDNCGRIFLDFDLEWIEPLLNYLRTNTWSDGSKASATIQKPAGCNIQTQLGFETIVDIFELNDVTNTHVEVASQATSRTSSFTTMLGAGTLVNHIGPHVHGDVSETATISAEARVDPGLELFAGMNVHVQTFFSSASTVVKQMESTKEEHLKKYKEIIYVKDYLKHWLVQCYDDQAHFYLQQLQAAKDMSPVKTKRLFGGGDSSFQPVERKASPVLYDSLDLEIHAMSAPQPNDSIQEEFRIVSAPLPGIQEPVDESGHQNSDSSDSEEEGDKSVEYHALLSAKTAASSSVSLRVQIDKLRDILSICTKLFLGDVSEAPFLRLPSDADGHGSEASHPISGTSTPSKQLVDRRAQQPIVYFNIGGEVMCILRQTLLVAFPRTLFATIITCAMTSSNCNSQYVEWAGINAEDVETLGLDIDEQGRIFMVRLSTIILTSHIGYEYS